MERPMGLEPTPGPWQGPVLPLYYGRPNQRNSNTSAFRRQEPGGIEVDVALTHTPTTLRPERSGILFRGSEGRRTMGSADLQYPRGLHDGRLSLPLGELGGLFLVRIDARESLAIFVKYGDLPMLMFSPPIFPKLGMFSCGFCFGHGLNISMTNRARKY